MKRSLLAGAAVMSLAAALAACSSNDRKDAGQGPARTERPASPQGPTLRKATFAVRHELKVAIPEGSKKVRVWFALPQEDPAQTVTDLKIESPFPNRVEKDTEGNTTLYTEVADPQVKDFTIVETFTLARSEVRSGVDAKNARPLADSDTADKKRFLDANANIVIDDRIRKLADDIVGNEKNPVIAARRIYDWELDNIQYWIKDPKNKKASAVGSSTYCLETKTGNCTDFHSLWAALARAKGIPTRVVYGSFLKAELDGQDVDQSYHCWPEFYAPGIGWVPHDVAVANIYKGDFQTTSDNDVLVRRTTGDGYRGADPARVEYYFGNLDERRVVWSSGRDLVLSPKQDEGPVNALPKAYVEIDGKAQSEKTCWTRKLTFREIK